MLFPLVYLGDLMALPSLDNNFSAPTFLPLVGQPPSCLALDLPFPIPILLNKLQEENRNKIPMLYKLIFFIIPFKGINSRTNILAAYFKKL